MNITLNSSKNRIFIELDPKEFTLLRRAIWVYYLAAMGEAPTEDLEILETLNDQLKES